MLTISADMKCRERERTPDEKYSLVSLRWEETVQGNSADTRRTRGRVPRRKSFDSRNQATKGKRNRKREQISKRLEATVRIYSTECL